MCMLFIKPENFTLPQNYFDSLKARNSNGLAMYNKKTGEVVKTLDYKEGLKYLTKHHDSEIVCHFRYATSGEKSIEQVHGWEVCDGEYILFHNGVLTTLHGDGWKVKNPRSDTQQLVHLFQHESVERLVSYLERFERTSRFLIVNKKTREYIIPKCATWNGSATIDGTKIEFSNNYAIDYRLLDGGFRGSYWDDYGYDDYGMGYSTTRGYGNTINQRGTSSVVTKSQTTGNTCSVDNRINEKAKDSAFYNTLFRADHVDIQIKMLDLLWQGEFDEYDKLRLKHPDVDVDKYVGKVSKTAC